MAKTEIYTVHYTNLGTPEANELFGVYATKKLAKDAMKKALKEEYNATVEENEKDNDYMYMIESVLVTE
jgi:hypothetical protein